MNYSMPAVSCGLILAKTPAEFASVITMSETLVIGEWRSRVNPFLQDALARLEAHGCTFGWAELIADDDTPSGDEPSFIVWKEGQPVAGWSSGDLQTRIHRAVRLAEARLGLLVEATV